MLVIRNKHIAQVYYLIQSNRCFTLPFVTDNCFAFVRFNLNSNLQNRNGRNRSVGAVGGHIRPRS